MLLYMDVCFTSKVRKISVSISSNIVSSPFLSVLFLGPLVCLLVCFMLPQGSAKLSSFFKFCFCLFVFSV